MTTSTRAHPGIHEQADYLARTLVERIDSTTSGTPPKRCYRLVIDAGGDTIDDLVRALDDIGRAITRNTIGATSGSPSGSYHFELVEQPGVTHESFFADLDAWREARR